MTAHELIENLRSKFGASVKDIFEKSKKRLYVTIEPNDITGFAHFLFRDMGCRFNIATAVDSFDCFEILYHFSRDDSGIVITIRAKLKDKNDPHIDSITPIIKGAEWIEREMHELFGIEFDGHPNMKPLLLADDWPEGVYPLRKDFVPEQRDDRG